MLGGRFRSMAWIVALIFFLAGLTYLVRPIYISTAAADEAAVNAGTETTPQSSGESTNSSSEEQSDSKNTNLLGLSIPKIELPKITLPKLEWKLPGNDTDSDNDSENNSDENNNGTSGENQTGTDNPSNETGGEQPGTAVPVAEESTAPTVVEDLLLPNTVIGSVDNSTFPYQMDMGDMVIETDNLLGDTFTASEVGGESGINLRSIDSESVVRNVFSRNSSGSLARMKWKWAMFNKFKIYQNITAPDLEPCHITIGSDTPVQVGAQDISVDTSELYANNFTDGTTFSIGRYWTINPAADLPRRNKGNGLAMLNGTNVKIKAQTIKATSISIPNLSITVEPGLKMSTVE